MTRPSFPIRPGLTLALGTTLLAWVLAQTCWFLEDGGAWSWHLAKMLPAQYMLCVCIHDAVHGVLAGPRRLNDWGGVLLAMGVALPFPLLRRTHLHHHDHLHGPEDPERAVYAPGPWALLVRLPLIPWTYLSNWRLLDGRERRTTALVLSCLVGGCVGVAFTYGPVALSQAFLVPCALTIAWFGFTTVYVPHSKYADTLMRYFNEHSGYHHDHHRAPQYPFNQYIELRAFHLEQGVFEPRGPEARVVSWLATPLFGTRS